MIIWGDLHGHLDLFRRKAKEQHKLHPHDTQIVVGDIGLGFPKSQSDVFPEYVRIIRGNHDSPEVCRKHPNYLGEFGHEVIDGFKVFWVGGAWSIDRNLRIEGRDWWSDEELNIAQLTEALELYEQVKPEIMITHDGPEIATMELLNRFTLGAWDRKPIIPTRTGQGLQAMFEAHKPEQWFFGHWHVDWSLTLRGTKFRCLNEFSKVEISKEMVDIL